MKRKQPYLDGQQEQPVRLEGMGCEMSGDSPAGRRRLPEWMYGSTIPLLALLAGVMVLGGTLKGSLAYFTTHAKAVGGHPLTLSTERKLTETYEEGMKHIQVDNVGDLDCYVRVRVFAGSNISLSYEGSENWVPGADGYWYYQAVVPAGGSTEELLVSIKRAEGLDESYNVIVVEECAPVSYDENGSAHGYDSSTVWSAKFEEGGA